MTPITREELIQIPTSDGHLAAILSVPDDANGHNVLIPWGAGAYPSSGRNRLRTRLARHLADRGFHALRFDYAGVGESTGVYRRANLRDPFVTEICTAARWLAGNSPGHLLVVANCFGGWSTLMAGAELPSLEGVAFINSPVGRDHAEIRIEESSRRSFRDALERVDLANLRTPAARRHYRKAIQSKIKRFFGTSTQTKGNRYVAALEELCRRNMQILLLYGDDDFREDFEALMSSETGIRLRGQPPLQVVRVGQRLGGCSALTAQNVLFDHVVPWLQAVASHDLVTERTP